MRALADDNFFGNIQPANIIVGPDVTTIPILNATPSTISIYSVVQATQTSSAINIAKTSDVAAAPVLVSVSSAATQEATTTDNLTVTPAAATMTSNLSSLSLATTPVVSKLVFPNSTGVSITTTIKRTSTRMVVLFTASAGFGVGNSGNGSLPKG